MGNNDNPVYMALKFYPDEVGEIAAIEAQGWAIESATPVAEVRENMHDNIVSSIAYHVLFRWHAYTPPYSQSTRADVDEESMNFLFSRRELPAL